MPDSVRLWNMDSGRANFKLLTVVHHLHAVGARGFTLGKFPRHKAEWAAQTASSASSVGWGLRSRIS